MSKNEKPKKLLKRKKWSLFSSLGCVGLFAFCHHNDVILLYEIRNNGDQLCSKIVRRPFGQKWAILLSAIMDTIKWYVLLDHYDNMVWDLMSALSAAVFLGSLLLVTSLLLVAPLCILLLAKSSSCWIFNIILWAIA